MNSKEYVKKNINKKMLYEIVAVLEKQSGQYNNLLNLLSKYDLQELYNFCKVSNYKAAREHIEKNY
jgi:hypothetical protein